MWAGSSVGTFPELCPGGHGFLSTHSHTGGGAAWGRGVQWTLPLCGHVTADLPNTVSLPLCSTHAVPGKSPQPWLGLMGPRVGGLIPCAVTGSRGDVAIVLEVEWKERELWNPIPLLG